MRKLIFARFYVLITCALVISCATTVDDALILDGKNELSSERSKDIIHLIEKFFDGEIRVAELSEVTDYGLSTHVVFKTTDGRIKDVNFEGLAKNSSVPPKVTLNCAGNCDCGIRYEMIDGTWAATCTCADCSMNISYSRTNAEKLTDYQIDFDK